MTGLHVAAALFLAGCASARTDACTALARPG